MKKFLLLLLLLPLPLSSYFCVTCREHETGIIPEFKVSYFRPYSNQVREIYGDALTRYDFDLNFRLAPGVWLWSGAGYWQKHGYSSRCDVNTRISDIPATLGIKFTSCFCSCFRAFLGVGARYDYLRIKSKVNGKDEHKDKGDIGVAITGGIHYDLWAGLYIFPFFEYSRNKITHRKFESDVLNRSIEVGGFNAGFGLGIWM